MTENHRSTALPSRRRLLEQLAVGGSALVAGCGLRGANPLTGPGDGSTGSPTGTSITHRPGGGQTFRAPIGQDPTKTTVYVSQLLVPYIQSTFARFVKENASVKLQRFLKEPGVWADGLWAGADVHYSWIEEPIRVSPDEVTVRIRDDARWSDGEPITGRDIALDPLQRHIRTGLPPYYATDEQREPAQIFEAIDDFEISDRSVTYRSSAGHFDTFWDSTVRMRLASFNQYTGNPRYLPTHVEPFDTYADAVIETARRAQAGAIDPWKRNKPWTESPDPDLKSLARKHLGKPKYVEKFSEATNVLATGAWTPVAFEGNEFRFEKNTHYPRADGIDFDTVVYEYISSTDRTRAALKGNQLDYAAPAATPASVAESFPDGIEQLRVPGGLGTGTELGLNFDHPPLGTRAARAAIMYALDQRAIANNIHRNATVPITTPGGDCWDVTEYVSRDWIDRNLVTYEHDPGRAERLMHEAGFTRTDGTWTGSDGEPLTLTIATADSTPRWQPIVASQLDEFGIDTTVQTLGGSTFSERVSRGKFPLWSTALNATNLAPATLLIWFYAPQNHEKYGIYPDEQFQSGQFSETGDPRPLTEERWRTFTVRAPPVGKPDEELRDYHPSALSLFLVTNPPEPEFRRRVKTGLWLANWFLPTLPVSKRLEQHFIDAAHWRWPRDTSMWKTFESGGPRTVGDVLAHGSIDANPDNPER